MRRGFVLAAILAVLVIATGVLGGAFFYALQDERIGRNQAAAARALAAAEAGAERVLAGWSATREGAVVPGDSLLLAPDLPAGEGSASVVLTPLGEEAALIRAHGVDPTWTAQRDVALLVRLLAPPLETPAALTTAKPLDPVAAAAVDGADHVPAGWTCDSAAPNVPAIGGWGGRWDDWDSLSARATPGSGLPDATHPAVLVSGDMDIIGGRGVGVLLVTGNVRIDGGAMLTGALLVRGTVEFGGAGGTVIGVVRADSISVAPGAISGGSLILWSACAVARARRALASAGRLKGWFWADPAGGW